MKRLEKAISELESYRNELSSSPWQTVSIAALNTVIATLANLLVVAPPFMRRELTNVDAMITELNDEMREDAHDQDTPETNLVHQNHERAHSRRRVR